MARNFPPTEQFLSTEKKILRLASPAASCRNLSGGQVSGFLCGIHVFQQRFAKRTLACNQQNDTSDTGAKDDNNNNDKQPSTNQTKPNQTNHPGAGTNMRASASTTQGRHQAPSDQLRHPAPSNQPRFQAPCDQLWLMGAPCVDHVGLALKKAQRHLELITLVVESHVCMVSSKSVAGET
jgi:hypothetical protein